MTRQRAHTESHNSEPKMVRFCILCGEREDSPYRSQWCDPDPVGTDYPYMQ